MADDTKPTTPYISFKTLQNLLDKLAPEPPPRIDKSVLSYLSGGYQMQVLAALKAISLIQPDGTPTEMLNRLVVAPSTRRETMKELWQTAYATVLAQVEIERATAGQLDDAFREAYGVEGETRRKAMAFFIHGAQFAEMPLSTLISGKFKRGTATARRVRRPKAGDPANQEHPIDPAVPPKNNDPLGGTVRVHEMLVGAIKWLSENGPLWSKEQSEMWTKSFNTNVALVYPPKRISIAEPLPDGDYDEGEDEGEAQGGA